MINSKQKKRRDTLFAQDPKCRFCGVLMVHPRDIKNNQLKNMLTLEHLNVKNSLERNVVSNEPTTTICCWECNQKRSIESQSKTIVISDFRYPQLRTEIENYLRTKKILKKDNGEIVVNMQTLGWIITELSTNFDLLINNNQLIIDTKGKSFTSTSSTPKIRELLFQRGKNLCTLVKHLFGKSV